MSTITHNTLFNRKPYKFYSTGKIYNLFRQILNLFITRINAAKIRSELNACTDHELDDIGIARYQIESVANGSYTRNRK